MNQRDNKEKGRGGEGKNWEKEGRGGGERNMKLSACQKIGKQSGNSKVLTSKKEVGQKVRGGEIKRGL